MSRIFHNGSTSNILGDIFIQDSSSTTGAGLTGLTNATSGLACYYHRDIDSSATSVSLASMTLGTFTSGGFKEVDSTHMAGVYQFCPPNAAMTGTNAKSVTFYFYGATNMAPCTVQVLLTQVDDQNATTGGITNIDAAVSSRSTYAGGAVASVTGAVGSVTAGVTVTTNNDKTGYSLTQSFPSNFASQVIDGSGRIQVQYGTSTGQINLSAGNLAGAVPSVTGAVGSVTSGVTVTTNNDKTGYSLTQSFPANFGSLVIDGSGRIQIQYGTSTGQVNLTGGNLAGAVPSVTGAVGSVTAGVDLASAGLDNVVVEDDLNARQALSIMAAALAGILAGAGTTTITIDGAGVVTNRITATVDSLGNRPVVVLSPPA